MGKEGDGIGGGDHGAILRRVDIAIIAQGRVGCRVQRSGDRGHHFSCGRRIGAGFPCDINRFGGLKRQPGVVGHDGNAGAQIDDLFDPVHDDRSRGVKADHAGAGGVHPHRGKAHAGQAGVDPEQRSAGGFAGQVLARQVGAEQFPVGFGPQVGLRRADFCGFCGQFSIGQGGAIGGDNAALVGPQFRNGDVQFGTGGQFQRLTRTGPGGAHPVKSIAGGR